MFALAGKFFSHLLPAVIKPLRILWNEIIGFVFLCLAGLGILNFYRSAKAENPAGLVLTLIWVLVMGYFGVSSFFRAKKISRS